VDDHHRAGRVDRGDHDRSQMGQQLGRFNTTYRQDRPKNASASIPRSSDLSLRKSWQSHSNEYPDTRSVTAQVKADIRALTCLIAG
jgi:conjugal transfer/entry exclusion protein